MSDEPKARRLSDILSDQRTEIVTLRQQVAELAKERDEMRVEINRLRRDSFIDRTEAQAIIATLMGEIDGKTSR
jgi:regulator of replication initiation timing